MRTHYPSCPFAPPASVSSLQLGDLQRYGATEVQEEGPFLFGQEGGGSDVVDAGGDLVHLHVAEATPTVGETEGHCGCT